MGQIIGIDLGTTNSVMAYWKRKSAECLDNAEGQALTPSVVALFLNREYIGQEAKDKADGDPANAIFSIKRFMGRQYQDEPVQHAVQRVAYKVQEAANGEVEVLLGGKAYTPVEISAKILSKLKRDAEIALGKDVTHAVITVPAYFGQKQKNATREAGRLAGLNVMRIITEPTAAALAYGVDAQSDDAQTLLVYDFGGGTFDISILMVTGGTFDVTHIEGDNFLGGDDLDYRLVEYIIGEVKRTQRVDLSNNLEVRGTLKNIAEKAKIKLSTLAEVPITVPGLTSNGSKPLDIDLTITRQKFESLIEDLVDRSIDLVRKALREANLKPSEIDRILLVGGTTKVPLVGRKLREVFGEKVDQSINPMECVALGAAVQTTIPIEWLCEHCHNVNQGDAETCSQCGRPQFEDESKVAYLECAKCGSRNRHGRQECWNCGTLLGATILGETVSNFERTPKNIGIEAARDRHADLNEAYPFAVVIPKDTQYPLYEPAKRELYTQSANQTYLYLAAYEGDGETTVENELIGQTETFDLPPGLPVNTPVTVEMSIDGDGVLHVRAYLTRQSDVSVEAKFDWGKTKSPNGNSANAESDADFNVFYLGNMNRMFGQYLAPDVRNEIDSLVAQGETALKNKDIQRLQTLNTQFDQVKKRITSVSHTFFWATYATQMPKPPVATPTEQQQVRQLMAQIEQDLRAQNYDRADQHLQTLHGLTDQLMKRVLEKDGRLKMSRM